MTGSVRRAVAGSEAASPTPCLNPCPRPKSVRTNPDRRSPSLRGGEQSQAYHFRPRRAVEIHACYRSLDHTGAGAASLPSQIIENIHTRTRVRIIRSTQPIQDPVLTRFAAAGVESSMTHSMNDGGEAELNGARSLPEIVPSRAAFFVQVNLRRPRSQKRGV